MPGLLKKADKKKAEKARKRYEEIWYPKGRPKKKKKSVGRTLSNVALTVADAATYGIASKVVKRVSCVEKAKKSGMSQREAAHFCATGKGKKIVKGPKKIRRSK